MPVTYQWQFNGTNLTDATTEFGTNHGALRASYNVVISNAYGKRGQFQRHASHPAFPDCAMGGQMDLVKLTFRRIGQSAGHICRRQQQHGLKGGW